MYGGLFCFEGSREWKSGSRTQYSITAVIFQSQKFEKSGNFEKVLQSLTVLLERTLKNEEMYRDF